MTIARPSEATPSFWIAAVLLGIAAATAFHLAPSLPFNVAFDEPLKVGFVLKGEQNFQHPLLMLQIVRLAALATAPPTSGASSSSGASPPQSPEACSCSRLARLPAAPWAMSRRSAQAC
jgi:hypothetical protein